jgi:DNA-binding MarR family transcriptional regulator
MEMPAATRTTTIPQALGRLRVALDDAYGGAARGLGLSAQQAELLCAVMTPAAVGEIARQLRCDRSNVSRLVDRAATRGLVHRREDQTDGRVSLIELSHEGQRLAEAFIARLETATRVLLETWSLDEQSEALRFLSNIADALAVDPIEQSDIAIGQENPR